MNAPATEPVVTRPGHYLRPFAEQLALRLNVETSDVTGALVDLALAGLIEISLADRGVMLKAIPLPEGDPCPSDRSPASAATS